MTMTMQEIRAAHAAAGHHFFDRAACRFFGTRTLSATFATPTGALFVTSENNGGIGTRRYTVRRFTTAGATIGTVGEYRQYATAQDARIAAATRARLEWPNDDLADTAGLRPYAWTGR